MLFQSASAGGAGLCPAGAPGTSVQDAPKGGGSWGNHGFPHVVTTVLVVDDEPIVREVVVRYLEREGYTTLEASDGERARILLESEPPDLVVLDVMLPGTDGLELCRWIRGRSDLPVIMLTARGEEADRIVGLELGADDYVTKPFSPRELAARVRSVLRRTGPNGAGVESLEFGDVQLER